jgi:predicted metalloprotease with PDZ domain
VIRKLRKESRSTAAFTAFLFLLLFCSHATAQAIYAENQIPARGVEIEYTVAVKNPLSHLYDVEVFVKGIREPKVSVAMPAWAPGAYTIRDFAKNVQDFRAANSRGQSLKWEQTDKQTWTVFKDRADDVRLQYQVYSTQLTDELADLNPPATFMYVVGQKHVPCTVKYEIPGSWKVYTGLARKANHYQAPDYDIFIDAPAMMGEFKVLEFETGGANHRLVFSKPDTSMTAPQVVADVREIVEAAAAIFGNLPYQEYTFLFKVQPQAGAGVEHLNSTTITVGENDFVNQTSYRRFLFVVAHEFVHAWNVKRIRPKGLGPFDYAQEVYTRLLWFSEGVTSYYADLLLARTGIYVPNEFLDKLASEINSLQHSPGRLLMSAEEASWNVWLRSDNAANNTISYYTKGEIIALLWDLTIRARTDGAKSLDDLMRYLVENYANKGIAFSESDLLKAVESVSGVEFQELYRATVQSRQELDYNRYLNPAALGIQVDKASASIYIGIQMDRVDGNLARVTRVLPNTPAERAKLDAGDVLVAMAGERVTYDNFVSRLHSHTIGESIKLTVLRGDRLMTLTVIPVEFQEQTWRLVQIPRPTPAQLRVREMWLGTN